MNMKLLPGLGDCWRDGMLQSPESSALLAVQLYIAGTSLDCARQSHLHDIPDLLAAA